MNDKLIETFLDEVHELLDGLEDHLLELEKNPTNVESPLKTTNFNPPNSSWGDIFSQVTLPCKFFLRLTHSPPSIHLRVSFVPWLPVDTQ